MIDISNLDSEEAETHSNSSNIADLINKRLQKDIFRIIKTNTLDICFRDDHKNNCLLFEIHPENKFYDNYSNIKNYIPNKYDGCYETALDFLKQSGYTEQNISEEKEPTIEELIRLHEEF